MNKTLLALCVALLLVGCSNADPTPTETSPPEEEEVLADCFVYFHLNAWVDEDGDGDWDEGELPLAGAEFLVDGRYASSISKGGGTSDDEGKATVDTWTPGGCPDSFTISATPPEGYQLTTDSPVIMEGPFTGSLDLAFGFQLVEGE